LFVCAMNNGQTKHCSDMYRVHYKQGEVTNARLSTFITLQQHG